MATDEPVEVYPLRQVVAAVAEREGQPIFVRVWEIDGMPTEYPFLMVETSLN